MVARKSNREFTSFSNFISLEIFLPSRRVISYEAARNYAGVHDSVYGFWVERQSAGFLQQQDAAHCRRIFAWRRNGYLRARNRTAFGNKHSRQANRDR